MRQEQRTESGVRLTGMAVLMGLLFAGLLARLTFLQTVQNEELAARAVANVIDEVPVPATRGRILDRHGRVLIDNLPVNVVRLDPSKVPRNGLTRLLTRLSPILGVSFDELDRAVRQPKGDATDTIEIARGIRESTILFLEEHREDLPGISTGQTWQRVYPFKRLASHVLGYVGKVTTEELKRQPSNLQYQQNDLIGKAGVEKSFERELRGVPGTDEVERDSTGRIVSRRTVRRPIPGADVRLTIDVDIQRECEITLVQGIRAARQNYFVEYSGSAPSGQIKATSGAVVVTDPNTGEVLCSASYPDFDPREFTSGISTERFQELTAPGRHSPLTNRVISGLYPPGSTFKLVTALAALQTKNDDGTPVVTPNDLYLDQGFFQIDSLCRRDPPVRCRWRNAGDTPFGTISLRSAIKVSSDAFFYRLGFDFTQFPAGDKRTDAIQKTARDLGLGELTQVRLPSEERGVVPDRNWLKRMNKLYPKAFPRKNWQLGDTINVSIGQGDVLLTPIQLNRTFAAIANGGAVLDQKIQLEVIPRDGTVRKTVPTTTPATIVTTTTVPPVAPTVAPNERAPFTTSTIAANGTDVVIPTVPVPGEPIEIVELPSVTTTTLPPVPVQPVVQRQIEDFPDSVRDPLITGLEDVVASDGGTALSAFSGFPLSQYPIAGKTGTAQKAKEQDYSLFVAFGPLPKPQYVVSMVIEEGGYGRQAAAGVRRMFEVLGGFTPQPVRVVSGTSQER